MTSVFSGPKSHILLIEKLLIFLFLLFTYSRTLDLLFSLPYPILNLKILDLNNQCTVWPSSNLLQNSIILQCSTVLSSTAVFQALHFYQVLKFYRVVLKRFYDLAKLCTIYTKLYYCQGTAW